jgi:hypothetical protein
MANGKQVIPDSSRSLAWSAAREFLADFRGCRAAVFSFRLLVRTETVSNLGGHAEH